MPVVRAHGGLTPTWGGYINAVHNVSPVNDTSILDSGVDERYDDHGATFDTGLYVMRHWQWMALVVGVCVLTCALGGGNTVAFSLAGKIPWYWTIVGALWIVVGIYLSIKIPLYYPSGKFVVLDQNSGLVHIPRLLGGYDRIHFQDASFVLVNRIHYGGMRSSFYWYLFRPGMDLIRDSVPYATFRWLAELEFGKFDSETQQWWSFVVNFMNKKTSLIPGMYYTIEEVRRQGNNPFKELWYWQYRRFRPDAFLTQTEPNWYRDENGVWARKDDHPWAWLCRPLKWLQLPAYLFAILSFFSFMSMASRGDWSSLSTSSLILLVSLGIIIFNYMLRFDARGSRDVPLYDWQGVPVGSLGLYEEVKRWMGFEV